ncbi:flavoprotein [Motilibacter rhizosphaerae]|uniref:flavoprotein n=1 Tax=Motilibacter rhizosphaerae TaxID=598652 RepID=UPI0013EE7688|nr:flavoprotein [Motilibacter rhizosphaerae]
MLLGVTGSISAAHTPTQVLALRQLFGAEVRVVLTPAATQFVAPRALAVMSGAEVLGVEARPVTSPAVDHVEVASWADLLLVLPATADFLARTAAGTAPDLLGAAVLAAACPVVVVPSMNHVMWRKPVVQRNADQLRADGIGVVPPVHGVALADGSSGEGATPPLTEVLRWVAAWSREREAVSA